MFTPDYINPLVKEILGRFNGQNNGNSNNQKGCNNKGDKSNSKISITPSQALVIGGIIAGVLEVDSVLIDKDQEVQIVLVGSLKQKTELEKMLDQIGSVPFDEVVKAMIERLT